MRAGGTVALEASHPLLFDALAERLQSVALAALVHVGDAPGTYAPLRNPRVGFRSLGAMDARWGKARRAFTYLAALPRILRAVRGADFCYVFLPGHLGLITILACRLLGVRYALYLRGDWIQETPAWARGLGARIFRGADFILSTGRELAEDMRRFTPRSEAVVPMSLLLHRYPVPDAAQRSDGAPSLLFVGEIVRAKGVFDLVESLGRLRAEGFDARLKLVGSGADKPELERVTEGKNLAEFVHFVGLMTEPDQLRDIYRESTVFCLPTYGEGFPRVIYEAMTFSLPILTTPVGQIPYVIEAERNGLFHAPGDVDEITACLARLLSDPILRANLGRAARATVEPMANRWKNESHGDQVLKWLGVEPRA